MPRGRRSGLERRFGRGDGGDGRRRRVVRRRALRRARALVALGHLQAVDETTGGCERGRVVSPTFRRGCAARGGGERPPRGAPQLRRGSRGPADSGAREVSALVSDSDDPQSERALVAPRDSARETPALVSDSDDPQSECGLSESRPPRFRRRANGVAMRLKNRRGGVGPGVGLTDVGPGVGLTDVAGVTSALVRSASALGADFGAGAGVRRISVSSFTSTNARSLALAMGPVPATLRHAPKDNRARASATAASSSKRRTTSAISSRSTSASFAPRPLQSSNAPVRRVTKRRVVGVAARFSSPVTTRASSRVSRRSP